MFKARRLLYHSPLGSRVMKKKKKKSMTCEYKPPSDSHSCWRWGGKPSFSNAFICATSYRIPASASTNQGPGKGDLRAGVTLKGGGKI